MDKEDWAAIDDATESLDAEGYDLSYQILMMGTSGVGKTIFMTTMLHDLLTTATGLRIETDSRLQGALRTNYQQLCQTGQLPPTARQQAWHFAVKYDRLKLFNFSWIDYRGGALADETLKQRAPLDIQKEFELVFDFLKDSVALFVLADAEALTHHPGQVQSELQAIQGVIAASLKRAPRGLHLVLVLTKSDAIALKRGWIWDSWDRDGMVAACHEAFASTFRNFVRGRNDILCDVVPLSAYGTSGKLTSNGIQIKNPGDKLKSFQVDVPLKKVFSSILRDIQGKIPSMEKEWRSAKTEIAEYLARLKDERWVNTWKLDTYLRAQRRREHEELKRRIKSLEQQLDYISRSMNTLKEKEKRIARIVDQFDRENASKLVSRYE